MLRRALLAISLTACSSSTGPIGAGGHGGSLPVVDAGTDASDAAPDVQQPLDAGPDASDGGGEMDAEAGPPPVDTLASNRDRLLGTYLDYLKSSVATPQSNGLSGGNVSSVCDVWSQLDPSARAVFLLLTARMQGSVLGEGGTSMLWHITRVYRISGGQGATATDHGSCGGDYNRMIMSMDTQLHAAQLAAHDHKGALQSNGKYDISDIPAGGFWRDTHDLAGPHDPFDRSDETEDGAPRGQTQYFADPASAAANAPLGRIDVMSLVDPYAIELDHDFDCIHDSNPLCTYITYGPLCFPKASALGTEIYTQTYGDFDPGWQPSGCGN